MKRKKCWKRYSLVKEINPSVEGNVDSVKGAMERECGGSDLGKLKLLEVDSKGFRRSKMEAKKPTTILVEVGGNDTLN